MGAILEDEVDIDGVMKVAVEETDVCEPESGLDLYLIFKAEIHFHLFIFLFGDDFDG